MEQRIDVTEARTHQCLEPSFEPLSYPGSLQLDQFVLFTYVCFFSFLNETSRPKW